MESEPGKTAPLQTGQESERGKAEASAGQRIETQLPFDLRELKEMLPAKARKLETNGSFYAGTLEKEWVYRKLCELGFLTDETKSQIETRRKAFQERGESFSFEQTFQELAIEGQKYIELLSRALSLAEAGILSEGELREFEECLRSGSRESGSAFLERKQDDAEHAFTREGTLSIFSLCDPDQLKKLVPLHIAFQSLPVRGKPSPFDPQKEKSYLCMKLRIIAFRGEQVALLSRAEFEGIDRKLAELNVIRRARLLGVITSQAHADALIGALMRR